MKDELKNLVNYFALALLAELLAGLRGDYSGSFSGLGKTDLKCDLKVYRSGLLPWPAGDERF
jgi:hypothetical protein